MSYRLAFVLGAVVFLLSGCGGSGPIPPPDDNETSYRTPSEPSPPPAVDEDAHHTSPEAYGCEVGDPIDNCKWEFPTKGGPVTVEAVRLGGLSVTVKDEVNGCHRSHDWMPNPAITGSVTSCKDGGIINDVARSHCCITTRGTVLEAVSGELRIVGSRLEFPKGVRIRYEDGKFVREQYP